MERITPYVFIFARTRAKTRYTDYKEMLGSEGLPLDHRDPPFSEIGDFKQWGRFEIDVPHMGEQAKFQKAAALVRKHIPLRLGGFYIIASEEQILHSGSYEGNLQKHFIHLLQQVHNGHLTDERLVQEQVWTVHYFTTP
ncbi:hypothetical protein [Exiguobacterium sp. AT1b]|uniref:hypothetical protein n=1 Tax=Exiguobacterium sp. (strain ATCC BAA-1283 / AT1b) TaxID=360911 RepID=UPI00117A4E3B|nr:hypothetical protein [Exiguobacterium sp. AT1b]